MGFPRTVTRDDSLDDDVWVALGETSQLLGKDNFLTCLDAAPQWIVGGGAQGGLHAHIAPHVDRDQRCTPSGCLFESMLDCLDAAFGSIDTDDDRLQLGHCLTDYRADDRSGNHFVTPTSVPAKRLRQPLGGGHGIPQRSSCSRVQPPFSVRASSISRGVGTYASSLREFGST